MMNIKTFQTWHIVSILLVSCSFCLSDEVAVSQQDSHTAITTTQSQPGETDLAENPQLPLILSPIEEKLQKTITIDFLSTPIEDVLRMISQTAQLDIVKSPKVTGMVTATLNNVPVGEVLDNILAVHGCGYIKTANMIRVVPISEITNVHEKIVSKVYRITYADTANVAAALQRFLSPQGSLSVNPGTSNIVVTDTESKVKAIDEFIEEIDRVTEQVVVEVRIYDVSGTDKMNIEVDWNMGRVTENNAGESVAQTTGGGIIYQNDVVASDAPTGPARQNRSVRTDPYAASSFDTQKGGSLRLGFLNDSFSVDMILSALRSQGYAKLLANPSILVLDNETATFEIIKEIPYQEESDTSQGGRLTSTKFKEVGVKLQVTPHITRDGMLRMHIMPEFGVAKDIVPGVPPTVDTRRLDTIALLRTGQTVVLGGLKQYEVSKDYFKTPIFGDLPLIAPLFRSETETIRESELLVFIRPIIISDIPVISDNEQSILDQTEVSAPKYPGQSHIIDEENG